MNPTIKANKAQVRAILDATFPEYRGRKFKVEFTETVTFSDTNWGGGTKNTYVAISTYGRGVARLNVPAPWLSTVEGKTMELPREVLVVKHTIFCGKDLGITIYAHPGHLPKWLSAGEQYTYDPKDYANLAEYLISGCVK